MTGANRTPHEPSIIIRAAAAWADVPARMLSSGGRLRDGVTVVRWGIIAELRARGYGVAEIGRILHMDHTSVMYAERRVLEIQDLCTHRGLMLRGLRDHLATEARPLGARHILDADGRFRPLRRVGLTDDGGQIWRLDDER